jgi:hypothetical protein
MPPSDFQNSINEHNKKKQKQADKQVQLDAVIDSGGKVASAVEDNTRITAKGLKDVRGEVKVTNPDLAKSKDVNQAVEAINKLNLTTFMSNEGLPQLAKNLSDLSSKTQDLQDKMESEGLKKMSDQLSQVVNKLDEVSKTLSKTEVSVDTKLQKTIDNLSKSINAIDFNPSVNVSAPETKVVTAAVDLKPLLAGLTNIEKAVKDSEKSEKEGTPIDFSSVDMGLQAVQKAITALRFPVSNYVLPFTTNVGKATQVVLTSDGKVPISGTLSGGDGAIQDGVTPTTKATVLLYTNSNPLAVRLTNTAGDYVAADSVTANAGTNLNTSLLALEAGGNLATVAGAITASVAQANVKQVNGVTTQTGTGTAGTGTQRVAVASDSSIVLATGSATIGALTANQSINNVQLNGNTVSVGVGASNTGTQRVIQANDAGKTLVSTGGSVASSGNNTLVAAGTNKLKVYAFSLSTTSSTAVTCIFQSGASGTELWRVILQAPASVNTGANLSISPPAWLFATASATLLNLNLSSAQTVHWSCAYYDEA